MADVILILNAGSSSLKFSVFLLGVPWRSPSRSARGAVHRAALRDPRPGRQGRRREGVGGRHQARTRRGHSIPLHLGPGGALGRAPHRCGGPPRRAWRPESPRPALLDPDVLAALEPWCRWRRCTSRTTWRPIRAVAQPPARAAPGGLLRHLVPPHPAAGRAGLRPAAGTPRRGCVRYGFHGLSYEYIASVLPGIDARAAAAAPSWRTWAMAPACARCAAGKASPPRWGSPPWTACRWGRAAALDPGVLLYLMDRHGMDARALEKLLYQQSGLLGVSGISSDMLRPAGQPGPAGGRGH